MEKSGCCASRRIRFRPRRGTREGKNLAGAKSCRRQLRLQGIKCVRLGHFDERTCAAITDCSFLRNSFALPFFFFFVLAMMQCRVIVATRTRERDVRFSASPLYFSDISQNSVKQVRYKNGEKRRGTMLTYRTGNPLYREIGTTSY